MSLDGFRAGLAVLPGPETGAVKVLDLDISERQCAQEPIHVPGSIQPHGMLLVLDPSRDLTIVAVSANLAAYLSHEVPDLDAVLGHRLGDRLGRGFRKGVQALLATGELSSDSPWELSIQLPGTLPDAAPELEAAIHLCAGLVMVEIEVVTFQEETEALAATRVLQRCIAELRRTSGDIEKLAAVVVRAIRLLTGYERVLIYRFDTDWHGHALAEDRVDDWEQSLSGVRFPASNIPAQARELYRLSHMRWMPDRDAVPVPLLVDPAWTGSGADGPAIDLSFARLRSFSPVHLAIHRAMGIDGSMSLSLIQDGKLWGLIVCHHRLPHHPSPGQRAAALALADAFSVRVGPAERAGAELARRADALRLGELLAHMTAAEDVGSALTRGSVTIASLFDAAGAAVLYENQVLLVGSTPPEAAVLELAAWLRGRDGNVFQTDHVTAVYPDWEAHAACASGVLGVFLSTDRSEMLLWFRGEETRRVNWGGNLQTSNGAVASMLPQQAFERWVEERHGYAKPWADWELEIAETLRHALTEVIVRSLRRISELNEQLRQSQKMEAVGQLTGGIAHDFNNLLAGIIGSLELTRTRVAQGRTSELDRYINAAMASANRAAALTHRLLAFSRRQTLDPKAVDVNRLAASMEDLIRNTVGASVHVETVMSGGLWKTLCDANQLENALLNLAINARDAMPDGGHLTIEATNARLDDAYARHHGVVAGQYVAVSVTDTGTGMAPEVAAHVFEPFFTTKPLGQGTGLGLSMVYGFVKQSEGYARVYSEPGLGTTVRLYLPRWIGDEVEDLPVAGPGVDLQADTDKLVLVVDDEAVVLMLVSDTLRDLGYRVVEAKDGAEALRLSSRNRAFDMMVSDVGLPGGLNGRQLADAMRMTQPGLPVLFITGYAENAVLNNGTLDPGMQVITKPFALTELAAKVKAMIH